MCLQVTWTSEQLMSKPVLFCDFLDIDSATTTANNDGSVNRVRHRYKTFLRVFQNVHHYDENKLL